MILDQHSHSWCPKANIHGSQEVEVDSCTFELEMVGFLGNYEANSAFDCSDKDKTAYNCIQDPSPVIGKWGFE